jgi:1-acyl-sn-glycerol-3-phosphate acyltransferase
MLRTALGAVLAPAFLLLHFLLGLVSTRLAWRANRLWADLERKVLGIVLTVEDRNEGAYGGGPYVWVVLNQTSLIEALVYDSAIPRPFELLVNIEFILLPLLGWSFLPRSFVVIRQWSRQAVRAARRAEARLSRGGDVALSIEGRRSRTGELSPFKKGPAVMAIHTGAAIVPVYLHGAAERLPYGACVVRPGPVRVTLCRAIPTRGLDYQDRDRLVLELRAIAEQEAGAIRANGGKPAGRPSRPA